jgi:hypothetical protein
MVPLELVMPEIGNCPRERPFWCSHPHCLFCNWDDNQRRAASALAAYVASVTGYDAPRLLRSAPAFAAESRRWVAWLCVRCARDRATVRWFCRTVRGTYPGAVVVVRPGAPGEAPLHPASL